MAWELILQRIEATFMEKESTIIEYILEEKKKIMAYNYDMLCVYTLRHSTDITNTCSGRGTSHQHYFHSSSGRFVAFISWLSYHYKYLHILHQREIVSIKYQLSVKIVSKTNSRTEIYVLASTQPNCWMHKKNHPTLTYLSEIGGSWIYLSLIEWYAFYRQFTTDLNFNYR